MASSGLQAMIRNHIALAEALFDDVRNEKDFEILSPLRLSLFSFRYRPNGMDDEATLDKLNLRLIETINDTGETYLTQNRVKGCFAIRFQIGQTNTEKRHVEAAWRLIKNTARGLTNDKM